MEQKLIAAALENRHACEVILSSINGALSEQAKSLFGLIEEYYQNDQSAQSVDTELLMSKIARKFPKHADNFKHLLETLNGVSVPNLLEEIVETRKQNLSLELSAAFAANNSDKIESLLEEYNKCSVNKLSEDNNNNVLISPEVSDIASNNSKSRRIGMLPMSLNKRLEGGALRGHHVLVYARPETGKSLFVLNMAAGFLRQGLKVLYVGNEDPASALIMRLLQRMSNMTKQEIMDKPDECTAKAKEKGYDNFIFAELSPGTIPEIRGLIEEHKPDVVVLDQLSNIDAKAENRVLQLGRLASSARNLGKEFDCLMVSVTQAGDSAENKLLLSMGDVEFSNTALQAQVDLMIGIGMNQDMEASGFRMLSFPKNKISGIKEPIRITMNPVLTRVE